MLGYLVIQCTRLCDIHFTVCDCQGGISSVGNWIVTVHDCLVFTFAYFNCYLVSCCCDFVHNIWNIGDLGHHVYKLIVLFLLWSTHVVGKLGARVSQGCMSIICVLVPSWVMFTIVCVYLRFHFSQA